MKHLMKITNVYPNKEIMFEMVIYYEGIEQIHNIEIKVFTNHLYKIRNVDYFLKDIKEIILKTKKPTPNKIFKKIANYFDIELKVIGGIFYYYANVDNSKLKKEKLIQNFYKQINKEVELYNQKIKLKKVELYFGDNIFLLMFNLDFYNYWVFDNILEIKVDNMLPNTTTEKLKTELMDFNFSTKSIKKIMDKFIQQKNNTLECFKPILKKEFQNKSWSYKML